MLGCLVDRCAVQIKALSEFADHHFRLMDHRHDQGDEDLSQIALRSARGKTADGSAHHGNGLA